MVIGSYKLLEIKPNGSPVYKRVKRGQEIFLFYDKNKWKISPDISTTGYFFNLTITKSIYSLLGVFEIEIVKRNSP
jgi:hypothetical protein